MLAADHRLRRLDDAKLLFVGRRGEFDARAGSQFAHLLRSGDLIVANDAATLPASLAGVHLRTGQPIEVRLAGRDTLSLDRVSLFTAVDFGAADFRTRTEDRPRPPVLIPGDGLALGPLRGSVVRALGHRRLVSLAFEGTAPQIWEGLARHGRPIQYAHVPTPLALWDVWTSIAGPPVAFETPSAGFALDWGALAALKANGVEFATITLAAGISSTGDAALDARLPLNEAYRVPQSTATAIARAKERSGRVVAIGTSVVRALEHSAALFGGFVPSGERIATQKIGASSLLRVVDAILTGVHEPGASHYALLRAFVDQDRLDEIQTRLNEHGFRTHEFGDFALIERSATRRSQKTRARRHGASHILVGAVCQPGMLNCPASIFGGEHPISAGALYAVCPESDVTRER